MRPREAAVLGGLFAVGVGLGAALGRPADREPAPPPAAPRVAVLDPGGARAPTRRVVLSASASPPRTAAERPSDLSRAEERFAQIFGAPVPWDDRDAQLVARDLLIERLRALEPDGEVHVECDAYPCVGLLLTHDPPRAFERRARELGARFGGWGQKERDREGNPRYVRSVVDGVEDVAPDDASAWGRTWKLYALHDVDADRVDPSDPEAAAPLDW